MMVLWRRDEREREGREREPRHSKRDTERERERESKREIGVDNAQRTLERSRDDQGQLR